MKKTPVIHTLRRAMIILGSSEQLAEYLEVPTEVLSKWLRGQDTPPPRPYLAALDLVSGVVATAERT